MFRGTHPMRHDLVTFSTKTKRTLWGKGWMKAQQNRMFTAYSRSGALPESHRKDSEGRTVAWTWARLTLTLVLIHNLWNFQPIDSKERLRRLDESTHADFIVVAEESKFSSWALLLAQNRLEKSKFLFHADGQAKNYYLKGRCVKF